jgi:hypothetical protein
VWSSISYSILTEATFLKPRATSGIGTVTCSIHIMQLVKQLDGSTMPLIEATELGIRYEHTPVEPVKV